jgi:hypothetical protein
MGYTARRRLFVTATAVFAALMLAALAVIARDGVSGATNRAIFGVLVMLWSVTLTGFPFALIAILHATPKAAPRGPGRPASPATDGREGCDGDPSGPGLDVICAATRRRHRAGGGCREIGAEGLVALGEHEGRGQR